ncbi:hypothetical protein LTR27_001563 [Elasticomyces elasticus]|nr:hypothetical protein LTR27_001563 [Elasticomyces elasticus]
MAHMPRKRADIASPTHNSPPALMRQQLRVEDNGKVRIGLDYGTKTLEATAAVERPGQILTTMDLHNVHFHNKPGNVPQQVAWDAKDNFYWGFEVESAIRRGDLQPGDVIESWKLLLDKTHSSSLMAAKAQAQLKRKNHTLDELLVTHLRAIKDAIKNWIQGSCAFAEFFAVEGNDTKMIGVHH